MLRRLAMLVLVGGLAISLAACASRTGRVVVAPEAVTVIAAPSLTVDDLSSGAMPRLTSLASSGAVALMVPSRPRVSVSVEGLRSVIAQDASAGAIAWVEAGTEPASIEEAVEAARAEGAPRTLLIVAPPSEGRPGIVVSSAPAGASGLLRGATTHRAGLVTEADIIEVLRAARDARSAGGLPTVVSDDSPQRRIELLVRTARALEAADRIRGPVQMTWGALAALLIVGGWVLAGTAQRLPHAAYVMLVWRRALLFTLCVPAGSTALYLIERHPPDVGRLLTLLIAASAALWVVAEVASTRLGTPGAVAIVTGASALIVLVDQLAGAPLALGGLFSYSPLMGFRFFGLGNEGASILIACALITLSTVLAQMRVTPRTVVWLVAVVGAVCVLVASSPLFGSNAMVAIWGPVTFAAFVLVARERRVGPAELGIVIALVVVALLVVVLTARLVPPDSHIGTAVVGTPRDLVAIMRSRLASAASTMTTSPLPVLLAIASAGFLAAVVRPFGRLARTLEARSFLRAAQLSGLVGAFIGSVAEDSGIGILALMVPYLAGSAVVYMLDRSDGQGGA